MHIAINLYFLNFDFCINFDNDIDCDFDDDMCSLFVPKDEGEETLLLLLISESIVCNHPVFHFILFITNILNIIL